MEEATPEAREFRAFVKSLPCAGCGRDTGVDAHHAGQHGFGVKSHWSTQIPLDRRCHDSLHDAKGRFAKQDVRRAWELMAIEATKELFVEWQRLRKTGLMPLTTEALLRYSLAWSTAWKGVAK